MITRQLTLIAATAVVGLSLGGAASALAASQSDQIPEIDWDTSLVKFQVDNDKFLGQRFTAKCKHWSAGKTDVVVYGTDSYPSDNSLCVAAVHAGVIDKEGGVVTVQLNPGESSYSGSERNGIQTSDLPGGTHRSFSFVDGVNAAAADQARQSHIPYIEWDTKFTATGLAYKQLVGQQFTFNCPAAPSNMRSRRIVGTDSYAFHSMICRAAVHAGTITTDGGPVTVQMDPGMPKLVGSIRNGVESKNGSSSVRTISFVQQVQAANNN